MAVPPPHLDDKPALRRELRARRRSFTGDAGAIVRRLQPLLTRDAVIAGYVAHGGEPDIMPFLRTAFDAGRTIGIPVPFAADGTGPGHSSGYMMFARWHPDLAMAPGLAGIPQPAAGDPVEPAIVLAPLLGFDRTGGRLGQGGGFYDRWFAAHPAAMRIGIAWSVQEVPALAREAWDMPLHAIVTEQEWIAPA